MHQQESPETQCQNWFECSTTGEVRKAGSTTRCCRLWFFHSRIQFAKQFWALLQSRAISERCRSARFLHSQHTGKRHKIGANWHYAFSSTSASSMPKDYDERDSSQQETKEQKLVYHYQLWTMKLMIHNFRLLPPKALHFNAAQMHLEDVYYSVYSSPELPPKRRCLQPVDVVGLILVCVASTVSQKQLDLIFGATPAVTSKYLSQGLVILLQFASD
jgi:hypothetical protein